MCVQIDFVRRRQRHRNGFALRPRYRRVAHCTSRMDVELKYLILRRIKREALNCFTMLTYTISNTMCISSSFTLKHTVDRSAMPYMPKSY